MRTPSAAARARQEMLTKPSGSLGRARRHLGAAGRPGRRRAAADPDAGRDRRVRRRSRRARAGRHARGRKRSPVRWWPTSWPGERSSTRSRNSPARPSSSSTSAPSTRSSRADGLLIRTVRRGTADMTIEPAMTRAEARAGDRGRHRGGRAADRRRGPLPGHRRHGHREHHRVGRAHRRVHRRRRRPRSPAAAPASTTRPWPARSPSSSARSTGTSPTRPTRSACWPRSAGSSTRRWPGSSSPRAAHRVPVILDGVIAGSAALVAQAFAPDVTAALIAGHRSTEPGAEPGAGAARPDPAARSGPASGRGVRGRARDPDRADRGPDPGRGRDLRQRRRHREELNSQPQRGRAPISTIGTVRRRSGARTGGRS